VADTKSKPRRAPRLGRGLSSLMAAPVAVKQEGNAPAAASESAKSEGPRLAGSEDTDVAERSQTAGGSEGDPPGLQHVPVDAIEPNPHQPRQQFNDASLDALAASIRQQGVMQPIVLRPRPTGHGDTAAPPYQLVAGERRWRAARLAGLDHVPALVQDLDDQQIAEWALVENLQREDLNPIDRAEAFQRLADLFDLTHDHVAERVGLDRSSVTNLIRLLRLAEPVRQLVRDGLLSMGQSRAIAGLDGGDAQQSIAEQAVRAGWSVRQVEAACRQTRDGAGGKGDTTPTAKPKSAASSGHLADLERQISEQLSTRVHIKSGRKKHSGALVIEFYDIEQFDALLGRLGVDTD